LGVKVTPFQTSLLEELLRTTDGKITLQSLTRAVQLWRARAGGVASQASLVGRQSRLLGPGPGPGQPAEAATEASAEDMSQSPTNGKCF
jgi:hypothetical protein